MTNTVTTNYSTDTDDPWQCDTIFPSPHGDPAERVERRTRDFIDKEIVAAELRRLAETAERCGDPWQEVVLGKLTDALERIAALEQERAALEQERAELREQVAEQDRLLAEVADELRRTRRGRS